VCTDTVVGYVLGVLSVIVAQIVINRLSDYPMNLFKTRFLSGPVTDSIVCRKPLILSAGEVHSRIFDIETTRECEFRRIGVRPQNRRHWYKHWFIWPRTDNIDSKHDVPIRILSIRDVTPYFGNNFKHDVDDTVNGRWGFYDPPRQIPPGEKVLLELKIEALKIWDGYIDFRWDSPNGRRFAHHRCRIK